MSDFGVNSILSKINDRMMVRFPGLEAVVGFIHLRENSAPPRLVWTLGPDSFSPPRNMRVGGRKALFTRSAGATAHIWAENVDSAERILHDLIAVAYREVSGPGFTMQSALWDEDPSETDLGSFVQLSFVFEIPVFEIPSTTITKITSVTQEFELGRAPDEE